MQVENYIVTLHEYIFFYETDKIYFLFKSKLLTIIEDTPFSSLNKLTIRLLRVINPRHFVSNHWSNEAGADPCFGVRGGEIRRVVWGPPRSPVRSRAEPWWGTRAGRSPPEAPANKRF